MTTYAVHPSSLMGGGGATLTSPVMAVAENSLEQRMVPLDHDHSFLVRCSSCHGVTRVFVDQGGGSGIYPRSVMVLVAEALARQDHGRKAAATHSILSPLLVPNSEV